MLFLEEEKTDTVFSPSFFFNKTRVIKYTGTSGLGCALLSGSLLSIPDQSSGKLLLFASPPLLSLPSKFPMKQKRIKENSNLDLTGPMSENDASTFCTVT